MYIAFIFFLLFFFFNDTATTEIYTLSLHDALPILAGNQRRSDRRGAEGQVDRERSERDGRPHPAAEQQECDECDSGRWPDRGDLTVDEGQIEAQARDGPIGDRDGGDANEVPDGVGPA